MVEKEKTDIKIDDDLYSRSIFTYGMETMKKLSSMKILIIGMRGLGIETAKNIILSGPGVVDIYDPSPININDLGTNFYLSENDVGKKNRDEGSLEKLSKLNPNVRVSVLKLENKNDMTEYINYFGEKIAKYNVVVFTELHPMYFIDQVDKICRSKNIKLIYGMCFGLVGYIFTDFGPKHVIFDENGREIKTFLVQSITKGKNGIVTIDNIQGTNNLNIGDGDYVRFKDVEGMTELNDEKKDFKIKMIDYKSFKIGDTSSFGEYKNGGIVFQVKKPIIKQYFPFCQRALMICDDYHPFNCQDYTKAGRSELLYMALSGIHDYYLKNGKLPELNNMEQAKEIEKNVKIMYDNAKENNYICYKNIQEYDEKIVLNTVRWSAAHIQPICALFGGIIAQEIIKATGKYTPIDQWLIFDFFETIENLEENIDRSLKKSRYDDQIAIFGNEIQEKIQKSNMFMVGAGATGCEFLKNFAMMGFCTDKNSKFVVTDNDNIEISNLSRQFLFHKKNVGQSKSLIAAQSVKEMNPNFNVEGLQTKVCDETENIFNENFWNKQNYIIYAVDSHEARKYIDNNVILYHKVGIDSGTKGTEAQSNIFIPHKTITYNDIPQDTQEKTLPVCTLRHFPSLIQHCIEWSKDSFWGYFGNVINDVKEFFVDFNQFRENIKREGTPQYQLEKLKLLKAHIDFIVNKDINKICEYAVKCYTDNFDHNIQQLLVSFPPNYKSLDGHDFWTGSKKLPHPIKFNINDDLSLMYVSKLVFILSHALGIEFTKEQLSKENIKKICSDIKIPEFVNKNIVIEIDEKSNNNNQSNQNCNLNSNNQDDLDDRKAQEEINKILNELNNIKREKYDINTINPEEFEKDHDENGHIDFIHAGSILRARNYKIEECDRNNTKLISGKIIPTILTTTACIAAVASLQLYTIFHTNENNYFRCCYLNLNSTYFYLSQPYPPYKMQDKPGQYKVVPEGWNVWDMIEIRGSKTCGEFIEYLKEKYNVIIEVISVGEKMIFATFLPTETNINKKIEDAYKEIMNNQINEESNYLILNVGGNVEEAKIAEKTYKNISALMPKIKYIFK